MLIVSCHISSQDYSVYNTDVAH